MSSERTQVDAFGFSSDTPDYVPRLALESALAELCELIGKTPECAALTGEAGLGKTLLLRVLRERLAGAFECLYLPSPHPAATDLWSSIAMAFGLGSGDDDRGAVLGRACSLAADGSGLVLLVDDAAALPASMREELITVCETPGLSLVLAFDSEALPQLGALPAQVRRIDLGSPMTLVETRAYVQARLRSIDPEGAVSGRLSAGRLTELHAASGGIPARLHALLDAHLRSAAAEPSTAQSDEPSPIESETAAAQLAAEPVVTRALPGALLKLLAQFQRPGVQLSVATLLGILIGGFWYFALQRVGGVASVGVPVERFEVPQREAVPAPTLPAQAVPMEQPASAAPEPTAKGAPAISSPAPAPPAVASLRVPARIAPRSEQPPAPGPSQPEPPVELVSARFPDEHVPATLEATPLGPPPPGPRLSVNAAPWAEIHLDGKPVGETPLGELAVAPGPHLVTAKLPDGRVIERSVEARVGDLYLVFPALDAATGD